MKKVIVILVALIISISSGYSAPCQPKKIARVERSSAVENTNGRVLKIGQRNPKLKASLEEDTSLKERHEKAFKKK